MLGTRCLLLGLLASIALAPTAGAAPPNNDAFGNAQLIDGALPLEVTGTNVDATGEPGEPKHAGTDGGASVWFRWTPSVDMGVRLATCGSDLDTLLAVYTGAAPAALTEVASNDQWCGNGSEVGFFALAGTTYSIAVDGWRGAQGEFALSLAPELTPNDRFADAQLIEGSPPLQLLGSTYSADAEPGEVVPSQFNIHTVWYRWTPPEPGPVAIQACSRDMFVLPQVFVGTRLDDLTEVDGSYDGICPLDQIGLRYRFSATAGQAYQIQVPADWTGVFRLRIPVLPSNDQFADAEPLTGSTPITVTGTNVDAGFEQVEPYHAGTGGLTSVWYRWTAPFTGPATVDTCESELDTVLAVYTGASLDALQPVGADDDSCGDGSRVPFLAHAGTTYAIAVDGFPDARGRTAGNFRLTVVQPPLPAVPELALVATNPPSPAGDNTPRVVGTAPEGATVRVYRDDPTCTGQPAATGSAADLSGTGVAVTVREDATSLLRATATVGDQTSACSAPLAYVEDSTSPAAPELLGTDGPRVRGRAQAGALVHVYADQATCAGSPVAVGSAAELEGAGLALAVQGTAPVRLRATASDAGGTSPCSSALAYAPQTPRCAGRPVTIVGTPRGETLRGTPRADVIAGLGGDDTLRGLAGDDVLCGGRGDDRLRGGSGDDHLSGGPGHDDLEGGRGADTPRSAGR